MIHLSEIQSLVERAIGATHHEAIVLHTARADGSPSFSNETWFAALKDKSAAIEAMQDAFEQYHAQLAAEYESRFAFTGEDSRYVPEGFIGVNEDDDEISWWDDEPEYDEDYTW